MKTLKKISVLLVLAAVAGQVTAQQDVMVNQYMFNQLFMNPAYAGAHKYCNATLIARQQWVNFDGAPVSQLLSADGKLKGKNAGIGFTLFNDHIGVSNRTEIYGNYAYHLKLDNRNILSMGLSGGVAYYRARFTDLTVWDAGDNVFTTNIESKLVPNFGTGLFFYNQKLYAGFSVPNLLNYKPGTFLSVPSGNTPQFIRHYYLTSGYVFKCSESVALKPSFLIKYVANAPVEADINVNVYLKNLVGLGASYRTGDSFVGIVDFSVLKNLRIGYAYDYPFTDIRLYTAGSHEVRVSYDFGKEAKINAAPSFF